MEIYLRCLVQVYVRNSEGHAEYKLDRGKIYKASYANADSFYNSGTSGCWRKYNFKEISKVEAFVYLNGNMDKVEELP